MQSFLKFRYFFFLLLLISCGDNPKKESGNTSDEASGAEAVTEVEEKTTDQADNAATILFFGDSLTAGYGLEPEQAFPALIQERLDSLGIPMRVVNAGLSGETTSGGANRLDWVLRQPVSVFVLELGANDGLRGIPLSETRKNLSSIIERVHERYPEARIVLAGMQLPPNMGPEYTGEFRQIFPELAAQYEVALIPFLLQGVGGIPELNQDDGIHPTAAGHQILADNVWEVLKVELEKS
ncbi:acyl-CoA thioesterase-1 [Robiginitalea myxolifaciens]|uniref:Acyl-CoA thioesterase-1 n=1 Tax=Robiginitalea myxolifaciens TaxID=400055 RepID=A0A1I6H7S0_9FLAO|nr:arylesterase [Robiginitalea myxolifaciens]SFR50354.1 acyl-CoA thioesterase-1 [Robiginitalea myxolifaciens]